jgi:predicted cupin superfamily sugar epimerase
MADELTADEIRALLKLEPNATCGFVQLTHVSTQSIAAGGLQPPFADARPMGSALYFMVTPTAPVRLHRIRNDQLYHYYLGDPLEVLLLHDGGTTERVVVGPDLRGGERGSCSFPATRSIPRACWDAAGGFSVRAPNGPESCRPTSRSAMSRSWQRNTPVLPPICARSRPPVERP